MRSTAQKHTLKQQALPDFRVVLEAALFLWAVAVMPGIFERNLPIDFFQKIGNISESSPDESTLRENHKLLIANAVLAHTREAASG